MQQAKRRLYCIHIPSGNNVGDACSAPYLYVPELCSHFDVRVLSIGKPDAIAQIEAGSPVIIGGGGLLANKPNWDGAIELAMERSSNVVAWGVGLNRHPDEARKAPRQLPSFATRFSLLGIRDTIANTRWVPCVSCLYRGFDRPVPAVQAKVGFYLHVARTEKVPETLRNAMDDFPVMTNGGNTKSLDKAVEFIGSCESIVTNSFHGMYWATLLGRKTLVFDVFSEKFNLTKWGQPKYDRARRLDEQLENAPVYPEALDEAREANLRFRDDVLQLLR